MKRQMNQTILENGVYGLLWAVVLVVPLFGYHDGSGIRWCGVFHFWLGVLPFALLFALHNYLLVPLLLMRRRYGVYVLCVVALIGLIFTAVPMLVIRPEPPAFYGREVRAYPEEPAAVAEVPTAQVFLPPAGIRPPGIPMPIRWGRMFNDWLLAVLVIGCNLAIRFLFKSIQDDRHLKELESQRLKTELNYLKAQVNPHFFMNTLNNIHALIDIDGERAKETVIELSRIMRYVLYDADRPTVPLRKEMEFIDNYIRLMRIRYAGEVEIRTLCPADPPDVQVPPLMLIILTENAFKHGMSYREGSFIDIRLTVEEGVLSYTVENSVAPDAERGSGVGLENLRKRLGLLYGSAGSLETRNAGGRYTAKLKIPVKR